MSDKLSTWEEAVIWLRSQPDQAGLTRACYYDDPLIDAADRFYRSSEWAEIQKKITGNNGRVLDLGAGRGISSYAFSRDGWDVVALEPDPSNIVGAGAIRSLMRESNLQTGIIRAYAESLPFKNSTFDAVYGRQILHHAQNLRTMCNEIARVLKPGGVFIATREHVISRPEDLPIFLEQHPLQKMYGGENAFLLRQYQDALANSGIKMTEILNQFNSDINLFPQSITLRKKQLAEKFCFPFPSLIPSILVTIRGTFDTTPGRLYSFIGRKK